MTTENKKGPSFRAKRQRLTNEIQSRDFDLYRQTNVSKIDAQNRFWLIIFTKPCLLKETKSKDNWTIRFWVWDSQEGKIAGENVLQYASTTHPAIPMNAALAECYVDETHQRLVLRPQSEKGYFIFNFPDGVLLHQTKAWEYNNDGLLSYSYFVNKDLFFCLQEGQIRLYILSQLIPKEINVASRHGELRKRSLDRCFYDEVENMGYLILSGTCTTTSESLISIYKRLDRGDPDEIYLDLASNLYVPFYGGIKHIDANKQGNLLTINIFPNREEHMPVTVNFIDLLP